MSYEVDVTGQISFDPPLTHAELRPLQHLTSQARAAYIAARATSTETPQGTLNRRDGNTIVSGPQTCGGVADDVQEIVAACPGRTWTGHLFCCGEQPGDLWRVQVTPAGEVVEVRPQIRWPDGSEGAR